MTVFHDNGSKPVFEKVADLEAAKSRMFELLDEGFYAAAYDGTGDVGLSSNPFGVFDNAGEKVFRA